LASQPTVSRAFNGLKISCQLLPELKIDMLKTSIGSCVRGRWRKIVRQEYAELARAGFSFAFISFIAAFQ